MRSGFTLVELAIVIVIIGLLVGGVLQGQELIKQAKINNTISTFQTYNAATNTFRAKYNYLPGDIVNPGPMGLNTAKGSNIVNTCYTTLGGAGTATSGHAGDGNGTYSIMTTVNCTSTSGGAFGTAVLSARSPSGENVNFYVHLTNAQLVKGSFSQAVPQPASWPYNNPEIGTAFPDLPVGETMVIATDNTGVNHWITGTGPSIRSFADAVGNSLTPSEAFGLDTKMDDGNPSTGTTQVTTAYGTTVGGLFTADTPGATACTFTGGSTYNMTGGYGDARLCTLRIKTGF